MGAAGLLDLSFRKFVSFSKFLGLLVDGFEKEIATSMSKLDVKKQFLLPFFFLTLLKNSLNVFNIFFYKIFSFFVFGFFNLIYCVYS